MKNSSWAAVKKAILDFLKGNALKLALKKLLGSAALGGFRGWLIKYVITHLFDEFVAPLVKSIIRKGYRIKDEKDGEVRIEKIEEAKENNNEDDYLKHISNS